MLTIGFTKKSAEQFFGAIQRAGARRVVDVRLNNASQLAGFSKKPDLSYFLKEICGVDYIRRKELAPTKEMLDDYRKRRSSWDEYESRFVGLMKERRIEHAIDPEEFADACLLCSEHKPHFCHRRLVAEYLGRHWGNVDIEHLEYPFGSGPSKLRVIASVYAKMAARAEYRHRCSRFVSLGASARGRRWAMTGGGET